MMSASNLGRKLVANTRSNTTTARAHFAREHFRFPYVRKRPVLINGPIYVASVGSEVDYSECPMSWNGRFKPINR
jgi:hypothetical protein